jgi:hypothetical protein
MAPLAPRRSNIARRPIRFTIATMRTGFISLNARDIEPMTDTRPRLNPNSPTYREQLWDKCINPGTGFVHCNLCGGRVLHTERWHESHIGVPAANDGSVVGIAHEICNLEDGHKVTREIAKQKRMRRKFIGADRPGLGKHALPCGRDSDWTKPIHGPPARRVKERGAKHRAMMARRQIGGGNFD